MLPGDDWRTVLGYILRRMNRKRFVRRDVLRRRDLERRGARSLKRHAGKAGAGMGLDGNGHRTEVKAC